MHQKNNPYIVPLDYLKASIDIILLYCKTGQNDPMGRYGRNF
jgi:hypothetical protein